MYLQLLTILINVPIANATDVAKNEDFENGISRWEIESNELINIITEPNTNNQLLQLKPKGKRGAFSHTIFKPSKDWNNYRVEGRFLFPTDGDGYLGFIYNYQKTDDRTDFGTIYIKSNGSYLRASPHYDGNPSWRLYEERRQNLNGEDKIQIGKWHQFRLDVIENSASLTIDNKAIADMEFELFHHIKGSFGLEARPGTGEPVWVDDLHFSKLNDANPSTKDEVSIKPSSFQWQVQGPFSESENDGINLPKLPEDKWRSINPDKRGLINTGVLTQTRSGDKNLLYLRAKFNVTEQALLTQSPTWLAFSSANNLDVWFGRYYRGTVGSERFARIDFLTSPAHPGARLSIIPKVGENEIIIKVYGEKFAAGGFFAELVSP
jgi:hypothetical protein